MPAAAAVEIDGIGELETRVRFVVADVDVVAPAQFQHIEQRHGQPRVAVPQHPDVPPAGRLAVERRA